MNESILLLIRQVYASAEQYGRRQLHAWGLSPAQAFVLDTCFPGKGPAAPLSCERCWASPNPPFPSF